MDFCFQGWVRGAKITIATNIKSEKIDVSKIDEEKLAKKLTDGELFISLGDYLYDNKEAEIEIFDFEE